MKQFHCGDKRPPTYVSSTSEVEIAISVVNMQRKDRGVIYRFSYEGPSSIRFSFRLIKISSKFGSGKRFKISGKLHVKIWANFAKILPNPMPFLWKYVLIFYQWVIGENYLQIWTHIFVDKCSKSLRKNYPKTRTSVCARIFVFEVVIENYIILYSIQRTLFLRTLYP